MLRPSCVLLLVVALSPTGFSSVLYNNTIGSGAASGLVGSQQSVLIDDVLVPVSRDPLNLPLAIKKATVEVSGATGWTANFTLWTTDIKSDGTPVGTPIMITTASLTFTTSMQQLTFGDGSTTLFTVTPNTTAQPGYDLFYIGLSAPTNSPAVDWDWANGSDVNLPTAYLYNFAANAYFLDTSSPPFPNHFSYNLRLEGNPVPEPSTWGLGLLGITLLAWFCHKPAAR